MRTLLYSLGVAVAIASSPAEAKVRYETFEARNSVFEGEGGTKTTSHGVDFWTTGTPPRRYQIIGLIRDNRYVNFVRGNPVGSSGIAKKVREAGGDAVILQSQDTPMVGVSSQGQLSAYGNQAYGSVVTQPNFGETLTIFVVVKYLPDS